MQKILKYLTPLITLGVVIFLIFFLRSINSDVPTDEGTPLKLENKIVKEKPTKVWLEHFAQTKKLGFSYPINEVFIKLDLNEKITKTITYKLYASALDPYKTFCLKEELKRHQLKYYLKQDKIGLDLLIYSRDVNKLNDLVKVLKKYQISATVKPYKEEY